MLIGQYFKNLDPKFKNHFFSGLSFNSKICKKNNIFFAIRGTNQNGNNFINDALKKVRELLYLIKSFKVLKKKYFI